MSGEVGIRAATLADADALARLATQLGYPTSTEQITRRLQDIDAHAAGVVLVASNGEGAIVGSAHVLPEYTLVEEPKAHLADLVVDESSRGEGFGAALLRACEAWACGKGLARMRVNSNVVRERAHRFYLREGYVENKRQAVFFRQLI